MMETSVEQVFKTERDRLSLLTRKGIGMPVAGLIYWLAVALILRRFHLQTGLVISFFATGAVFPLGALLTRIMGGDLFAKSAVLTPLGLQLAAVQLFYWPIIVLIFRHLPEWTPFAMAVLFGSHFLAYGWLYRSPAYAVLAGLTTVAVTVAVLATQRPLFAEIPLIAAGCYAVACVLLAREVGQLKPPAG